MSLKSFLEKIWGDLTSIFEKFPAELKVAVGSGVVLVENLKNFVNSPVADILTAIIPGSLDDSIKTLLRNKLPGILTDLKLVDTTLNLTDPNEIVANAIKVLQEMDPNVSPAFLHSISILVAQVAADGKLSWSDAVYIQQWYYNNVFQAAA